MIFIYGIYEYVSFINENGELHRLDGPAVIDDNVLFWYIEGKEYTESEYYKKLKEMGL